ncbi:unnamed protein product [Somion occarium]
MAGDLLLHLHYSDNNNYDMRTFRLNKIDEDGANEVEFYKFFHPLPDSFASETTYERMNLVTGQWEKAGHIEWNGRNNANVYFGGMNPKVNIRELRRVKKSNSQSRRFKAGDTEYKWKISPEDAGLFCETKRGKVVATWTHDTRILTVGDRVHEHLDRVVVTFLLNLWMWQNKWW